jgi:hypothetical protein
MPRDFEYTGRLREITAISPRDAFHGAEESLYLARGRFVSDTKPLQNKWETPEYTSSEEGKNKIPLKGWYWGYFQLEEPVECEYKGFHNQVIHKRIIDRPFFLAVKTRLVR